MPTRKKCSKKKKKKNINNLQKKSKSLPVGNENVVGTSRDAANKLDIDIRTSNKECSKSGSNRSPIMKLPNINSTHLTAKLKINNVNSNMTYQSPFKPSGLTPKEKYYVICRCQASSNRYMMLKKKAAEAIKHKKIFTIYGSCNVIRKALLDRGWVEKIPANRMNLSKIRKANNKDNNEIYNELESLFISNMVEKSYPNFVWHTRDSMRCMETVDKRMECNVIINRLNIDAIWTTKEGLCTSLKGISWFYIEDVAEVNSPRTYSSYDPGEIEDFAYDYKVTACTSLLKWVLSMVANERPIFLEQGKVSVNVIVFALNRCKEYIFRKQNKDIDKTLNSVSAGQWNTFLRKYSRIISKEDVFKIYKDCKIELYLVYARILLQEIHKYRPQLSCEGCHNIWIIKPSYCSRGRGIRLASKLGVITNSFNKAASAKYVIQKYIEEPLLIHGTKFDIRQYYLVTSTYPLVIWMYTDCYLKFSSQKYSLKNYHESIHLTNNAVQRKYKNCTERHPELPRSNMWDLDTYKSYLIRIGRDKVWDNVIYPGMKKSIIGIMLSCQDTLSYSKNRFALYGCDFILDKYYNTWLIEINSRPDLSHTTPVTAKICPAVLSDIIKVVVDYVRNRQSSTGKFQCVYRQPMSGPRYGLDLSVRGYTLPPEYFYRGPLPESFDHPEIEKQRDIKATLTKLKLLYDLDLMVQPEDDDNSNLKKEQETCTHLTKFEQDLQDAATVINQQLDYLLDKVTSEHTAKLKSAYKENALLPVLLPTKKSSKYDSCLTQSVIDIKSLLKQSLNRFASSEAVTGKRQFFFSKLDDGLQGKASLCDTDAIKLCYVAPNDSFFSCSATKCDNQGNHNDKFSATKLLKANVASFIETPGKAQDSIMIPSNAQDSIMEASSEILNFLNKKAKEYVKDKQR